jgi:cobalamin biosynthesis protein CbiG
MISLTAEEASEPRMNGTLRRPKQPVIDVPAIVLQISAAATPIEKARARQAGLDTIRHVQDETAAAAIRAALRRAGLDR